MKKQSMYLGLLAVLVIGGVIIFAKSNRSSNVAISPNNEAVAEKSTITETPLIDASSAFSKQYLSYSKESLATAQASGKSVIFFHAGWCPTCKAAEADFKINFSKVPGDVTILKADYDTETALKTKYDITMQDTFVQVDENGKEITKWNSGGEGVTALLANVK